MCDGFSEAGAGAAVAEGAAATAAEVAAADAAATAATAAAASAAATTAAAASATAGTASAAASAGISVGAALDTGATAASVIGSTVASTLPSWVLPSLQIASAAAGLVGMRNTEVSQTISNNRQTTAAFTARADNANQVGLEQIQQHDLATQKIGENNLASRDASAAYLAQGQTGGLSVDALLGDIASKADKYNSSVTSNLNNTNMALGNQMQNINTTAANVIAQEKTPPLPDYLGTSLKIGGDYGDYLRGPT
jgi:hypothetical protein